jgi:hypothetical protein
MAFDKEACTVSQPAKEGDGGPYIHHEQGHVLVTGLKHGLSAKQNDGNGLKHGRLD